MRKYLLKPLKIHKINCKLQNKNAKHKLIQENIITSNNLAEYAQTLY